MSSRNTVNPGQHTQAGHLTPDDSPRERARQNQSPVTAPDSNRRKGTTGISNRESADEEQDERDRLPSAQDRSQSNRAGADAGNSPADTGNEQTSAKTGSRSGAQKAAEAKYVDRAHPASEKVEGAFGREPRD
jgi:hypothetical protein